LLFRTGAHRVSGKFAVVIGALLEVNTNGSWHLSEASSSLNWEAVLASLDIRN